MLDPTGFYANIRDNVATPLLAANGFQAVLWVKAGEVFDEVSGTITTPAKYGQNPVNAVYGGGSTGAYAGSTTDTEGKTLTRRRTKELYLDATSLGTVIPLPDDLLETEDGNLYEILRVEATNPGGVVVLWRLRVLA